MGTNKNASPQPIEFACGQSLFGFLPTGAVREFRIGGVRINSFAGDPVWGGAGGLWLRTFDGEGLPRQVFPLWPGGLPGPEETAPSRTELYHSPDRLAVRGIAGDCGYTVSFLPLRDGGWCWRVELDPAGGEADLIFAQDTGLALRSAVMNNELYASQYLGHSIFRGKTGYTVCSRQNLPQNGKFPCLQQGMLLGTAAGYATDATQLLGPDYRRTSSPLALTLGLPSRMVQGELACVSLQSERFSLESGNTLCYYGLYQDDHPAAVKAPIPTDALSALLSRIPPGTEGMERIPMARLRGDLGAPFSSRGLSGEEVASLWPDRLLEERREGRLLSFFTPDHTHVVLGEKDSLCPRPHGHILTTAIRPDRLCDGLLTSTNAIYGLFNGQTAIGNTSFHKIISAPRGLMNQLKGCGQRLWVRLSGRWRQLTLPAAYELGGGWARWRYLLPDRRGALPLTVTVFTAADSPSLVLTVKSARPVDLLLTTRLVMGEHEGEGPVELRFLPGEVTVKPDAGRETPYPGWHARLYCSSPHEASDDRVFFADGLPRDPALLTHCFTSSLGFRLTLCASLSEEPAVPRLWRLNAQRGKYESLYRELTCGLRLGLPAEKGNAAHRLNAAVFWFTHNALVHFAAPHGLEQTGGAAWGCRDVCQGPFEFFMATGHHRLARELLLRVFSHQWQRGEWPQWFMYDRYRMDAGECHGDVVLWPLKATAEYLLSTGDYAILKKTIPWQDGGRPRSMWVHLRRAVEQIEGRFLPGTMLMSYAGGDWDDTLQPASPEMRERLVSAWTQSLGIQTLRLLSRALEPFDAPYAGRLCLLAEGMEQELHRRLTPGGTVAGFLLREPDGAFTPLLHPQDSRTGIRLRLLPMTRGILAGIASPEQARRSLAQIDESLLCPDGVRLMDRPVRYSGGPVRLFQRAEQAANVGREIGLQYVHAHIRYAEALTHMGEADRALWASLAVCPPGLWETVPNALPRQQNAYFSSSDPAFDDRAAFEAGYDRLRRGEVPVLGGWRIYSSGPGIWLSLLIGRLLGLRLTKDALVIDPGLPPSLDGLRVRFTCFGRPLGLTFHITKNSTPPRITAGGVPLPGSLLSGRYRPGGISLPAQTVRDAPSDEWEIEL